MPNTEQTQPTAGAMRALHTPTPWLFRENPNDFTRGMAIIQDKPSEAHPPLIAKLSTWEAPFADEALANGKFIAQAVNAHAALVESLNDLVHCATCDLRHMKRFEAIFAKAIAVLARHAGK